MEQIRTNQRNLYENVRMALNGDLLISFRRADVAIQVNSPIF